MKVKCIDDSNILRPGKWRVKKGETYTVSMCFHDGVTLIEDTQIHPLGTKCQGGSGRTVCPDGRFRWNVSRFEIISTPLQEKLSWLEKNISLKSEIKKVN